MDRVTAIEIQALLDAMEGDFLYHYRRICRWYSTTFHTPLPMVEEMSEEDVLRTFFEHKVEEMPKAERRKRAIILTETDSERKARLAQEKSKTDDAFAKRIAKQAIKAEKEAAAKRKLADEAARKRVEELATKEMVGAPKLPDLPEFSMKFSQDGNLLSSDDEDCLAPPPRK